VADVTVRETSIEAYNYVKDYGNLPESRWSIYSVLFEHGPLTATECFQRMKSVGGVQINYNTRARLNELRDMGLVRELGTKRCSVTNMDVILWDVTANKPTPLLPKKGVGPSKAEMRKAVEDLREIFKELAAKGKKFSPELLKVCGWLAQKAK
jgi:hypothetical protein